MEHVHAVRAQGRHQPGVGGFPPAEVADIAAPDNVLFDGAGNMWIATDGQPSATSPVGAEVTAPCLTPDDQALFVAIQHPGEGGTLAAPLSQWPDGRGFSRSSLAVVTKTGGGRVGS